MDEQDHLTNFLQFSQTELENVKVPYISGQRSHMFLALNVACPTPEDFLAAVCKSQG